MSGRWELGKGLPIVEQFHAPWNPRTLNALSVALRGNRECDAAVLRSLARKVHMCVVWCHWLMGSMLE